MRAIRRISSARVAAVVVGWRHLRYGPACSMDSRRPAHATAGCGTATWQLAVRNDTASGAGQTTARRSRSRPGDGDAEQVQGAAEGTERSHDHGVEPEGRHRRAVVLIGEAASPAVTYARLFSLWKRVFPVFGIRPMRLKCSLAKVNWVYDGPCRIAQSGKTRLLW